MTTHDPDRLRAELSAAWGPRFGSPVPTVALELLAAVLVCTAVDAPPPVALVESAAGVGLLRAHQGHDAATLVEDLVALRLVVAAAVGPVPRLAEALDLALPAAVGALVGEPVPAPVQGATRDPLTGLLGRPVFEEALAHEVAGAARHGAPSLVVVDLDGLTRYMEVQGHLAADLHLVRVVEILLGSSRRSDHAGRLGLDQVAVLLPRTDLPRAMVVARRVLARSLADARAGERERPGSSAELPRLSVGVGYLPRPRSAHELLDAAAGALDRARRAGGRVVEVNRLAGEPDACVVPASATGVGTTGVSTTGVAAAAAAW